jgi:hypothetical protein
MNQRSRRTAQGGQAMLETALVFTTVMCMIIFIMDMGRLIFYKEYFAERARVGARWASVNGQDATSVKNVVAYNSTTGSGPGYFGLSPANVSVTYQNIDATHKDPWVTVTITGFQTFTMIPYIAGNYTIPAIAVTMPQQSMGATT